ncbi:MAG: 16S rRNA (cytidine(1402)-2'-O)-methyltransferase [Thermoleophilia bacterium]
MLYICATPIGNLGDVSARLLEVLRSVTLIAAEDTRRTRALLTHFDVHTPLTSLFRHNEARKTEEVMRLLRADIDVALVSDAGMPGVSDPGMRLVAAALEEHVACTVVPGPSAVLSALVLAGFEGDGFRFVGYLPRREKELREALRGWRRCGGLVVAFDTAPRLPASLASLAVALPQARAAVCRELTKLHEEIVRGDLRSLSQRYAVDGEQSCQTPLRGEITLVLDLGDPEGADVSSCAPDVAARELLGRGLSRRDTAMALHVCLGLPRREADVLARTLAASVARSDSRGRLVD